ncbi:uncharacterized protein [Struthio camelus]|uniref:uncharacterized protein n=1 Tax=Struthio camelus TaxID=8801 RepID=UPI00360401A4
MAFEYLQGRRLHYLSGQPVPMLCHPHSEEVLSQVQVELPVVQFLPIASCPVAGHHGEEAGLILLTLPLQILIHVDEITSQSSLLQAEQAQLLQSFFIGEMLQPPNHLGSPPLDSLQQCHVPLVLGSPELDTVLQVRLHQERGRITSLDLLPTLCLMHPRRPLAFLATRAHCCLMLHLLSTGTPRSFFMELLSSRSTPSLYWCMGLFLPRCRTLHLPLLNFRRVLSAQLSSLSRSLGMAAQSSGVSAPPPSSVSAANLLRVHSVPSSRSLMNTLNKSGPRTDPWGTPLATGLQLDSAPFNTTL